jgi:hypothetical protein
MKKINGNVSEGCRALGLGEKIEKCRKQNQSGNKPLVLDFRSSRSNVFAEQGVNFDNIKLKYALNWPWFSGGAV